MRERKGCGPGELEGSEEQGNGREKETFKDCVRFVVTEGDRVCQDWASGGEEALLAGYDRGVAARQGFWKRGEAAAGRPAA